MPRRKKPSDIEEIQQDVTNAVQSFTGLFIADPSKRKGWENLSSGYRKRLQRTGITEELYRRGASLAKARGHVSERKEAENREYRRSYNRYVNHVTSAYGASEEEVRDALSRFTRGEIEDLISRQKRFESEYAHGTTPKDGKTAWENRDRRLPDWMYYYHSVFS